MEKIKSEKGEMSLGGIIFWLIVVVAGYVAFQMAMPWVRYNQVKELFRQEVASLKVAKVDAVRDETRAKLKEMGIALYVGEDNNWEDITIIVEEGKPAIMKAKYYDEVMLPGGYTHVYTFYPEMASKVIINPQRD